MANKKIAPRGKAAAPKLKTMSDLTKPSVKPVKPRIPGGLTPMGGGTGEPNPPIIPRNSQKGIKQQVPLNIPGMKLR